MATHGTLSIWLAEIGRRLHEGETSISLKELEAWAGTRVEPKIDAYRLWDNLWLYLQHAGFVAPVHHSGQDYDDAQVDVRLTAKGSETRIWSI